MNVSYISYDELGITVAVIGIALAFLVLTWNAVKAVHDWRQLARRPTADVLADHGQRIHVLEEHVEDIDRKLDGDWEFRQREVEMNRLMLRAIRGLLAHGIDGNDVESLRSLDKEIGNYLVDHQK
jgi:hypothetical protein